MTGRKFLKLALLLMLAVFVLVDLMTCDVALAQKKSSTSADADLGSKKGLDVLSGGKKSDPTKAAKPWQKALGFGSFIVMIVVIKWL